MTLAERRLLKVLVDAVGEVASRGGTPVPILNLGAGKSTVVENRLVALGVRGFISDRVDVEDCTVRHDKAGRAYQCWIEHTPEVPSAAYAAAFPVWVLEHAENILEDAREVARVLRPGGLLVATVPNPSAPEFVISRHTPELFHLRIKSLLAGSKQVWETHYGYKSGRRLGLSFQHSGLKLVEAAYSSLVQMYLRHFPLLRFLGKCYDSLMNALKLRRFQGNVCLVFRKMR